MPKIKAYFRPFSAVAKSPANKNRNLYLNAHGFVIAQSGPGSLGNETKKFGNLTKAALIKFQKVHNVPPTGYFGPMTQVVVNQGI